MILAQEVTGRSHVVEVVGPLQRLMQIAPRWG